jgi:hypothetical protein
MAFRFETANERWREFLAAEDWQPCSPDCKECQAYQTQLDRYNKLMEAGRPQAAEYWKQTILKDLPHQEPGKIDELQESFISPSVRAPRPPGVNETGNKSSKTAGDLIQFPDRMEQEEPDKRIQIEFYNQCAQVEKLLKDVFNDGRYESIPDQMLLDLHQKARDLVWNADIDFTQ